MKSKQTPLCIAVAGSKGGSGKTSLTANLCVRAAQDSGRVVAMDLEPQQSLARWFELRQQHAGEGEKLNPRFWGGTGNPTFDVQTLKAHGADFVFLDLPPADMDLLKVGIRSADYVVIPVKPSPVDIEALGPVVEACALLQREYCFVLSMFVKGWKLNPGAAALIEKLYPGHLLDPHLESKGDDKALVFSLRPAYVSPMARGGVGAEYNADKAQAKACASEVDRLWRAIKSRGLASVGKRAQQGVKV